MSKIPEPPIYQCQVNRLGRFITILVALIVLIFAEAHIALGFAMGLTLCIVAFKLEYIEGSDRRPDGTKVE